MYTYKIEKKSPTEIEIVVDIPKNTIKASYQKAFEELRKDLSVAGFRKGTVPKQIAEQKIKKEEVFERLIQDLFPQIYREIIIKENLKPIINPQVDLIKAKEDEDWQIKIQIAQKPKISLGDYKKKIKDLNQEHKKADIWIPGKEESKKNDTDQETERLTQLNRIFQLLLKEIECPLPALLIEQEVKRKLADLIDELQKLGLNIEDYLKSKNLSLEQLKENYKNEIKETYQLEFILDEIANQENIVVENDEIEKIISKISDEKEKETARQHSYYYAAIIRKQKTLDFLLSL